jgi:hypothetical protein
MRQRPGLIPGWGTESFGRSPLAGPRARFRLKMVGVAGGRDINGGATEVATAFLRGQQAFRAARLAIAPAADNRPAMSCLVLFSRRVGRTGWKA